MNHKGWLRVGTKEQLALGLIINKGTGEVNKRGKEKRVKRDGKGEQVEALRFSFSLLWENWWEKGRGRGLRAEDY